MMLLEFKKQEPYIHIYRQPKIPKAAEKRALGMLERLEKAFLGRRICSACDKPLDRAGCGELFGLNYGPATGCSEEGRINRIKACLDTYKPRIGR